MTFKIEYQVYLLNIFPFDVGDDILPMAPEHDYMNFLPIESLKPFERKNFFYLENRPERDLYWSYFDREEFRFSRAHNFVNVALNYFPTEAPRNGKLGIYSTWNFIMDHEKVEILRKRTQGFYEDLSWNKCEFNFDPNELRYNKRLWFPFER